MPMSNSPRPSVTKTPTSAIEYGLIVVLISIAALAAFQFVGPV